MNEAAKKFLKYSIWVAIILFVIRCFVSIGSIRNSFQDDTWGLLMYDLISYAGEAIGLTTIIMALFNTIAWKWRIINKLVDMPVLARKYTGMLVSNWNNEVKELEASLEVRQTFLSISIVFITKESRSYSLFSTINTLGALKQLIYIYQNKPNGEINHRSPDHCGTVELWIDASGELQGNYYTNRNTLGHMTFKPEGNKNNKRR